MRHFIFKDEREYSMITEMWQALGFHFAVKKGSNHHREIIVYLLNSGGN